MSSAVVSRLLGLAPLLAGLLLAACAGVDPVVKLALVGPFEGRHRLVGYDVLYSARLAVRQANAVANGDYRVALVALDDGGDAEMAESVARSLVIDPAVVAVIGHWQAESTAAAQPIYAEAGLPLLAMNGHDPGANPAPTPADFHAAYETITPFDETPGPLAWPAYESFQLALAALTLAEKSGSAARRADVARALEQLTGD
jgi:branched-chain amino acid transport system substrate-binding protein